MLYKGYCGIAFIFCFLYAQSFLIYAFFHVINIFMIIISVTSIHCNITCVAGMVILLCVLRADTFMCLLFNSIEPFTLYFVAIDERK